MNILYTITSLGIGGAEKLLVDTINNLPCTKDDSIHLCIINKNYDEGLLKQIDPKVNILFLNRIEHTGRLKYFFQYTKFVIENKIDVIHCQCEKTVEFAIPSKLIRHNIKIVHTVHDTNVYNNLKKIDVLADKLFTHKIIAISDVVKGDILSRGIKENQVETVYNSIDLEKFKNTEKKVFDKENIVLGNVARLMPEKKGQDLLIKAVAKLKNNYPKIKCILAGAPFGGDTSIVDKLKELAKKYDVEENIIFEGAVSDVPSLLKKIDIFVMPSRFEGFGISLIEAMAMGKPCIASNVDGPAEIIKNNEYGILFKTGDYEDLVIKLENMIENIELYDADKTVKYVQENFSITEMTRKINEIYLF